MRLSHEELKELLKRRPGLSVERPAIIDVSNPHIAARKIAELESNSSTQPLAKAQLQETGGQRFSVRVISVRKRLIDEDNLAAKFCVDQCRYLEILPDDCPSITTIQVTQRKCEGNEEEHVEVIVDKI